jgi:putative pyrroloquinoline-quinone-binding quinoprotein
MNFKRVYAVVLASSLAGGVMWAQSRGGGSEWLTAGGDAQRTSWIRSDAAISVASLSKPGFELQWKTTLDNQSRGSNGLAQGVTANGVTLFVPMSVVTGSSNNVYAIDNDTGYTVWQRHFDAPLPAASVACPGGITAAATRIVAAALPAPPGGRGGGGGGGGGRGASGYRGAVSEPGQGVPTDLAQRSGGGGGRGAAPAAGLAAPGAPGAAATPPGGRAAGAGATPPDPARAGGAGAGVGAVPPDPARAGGAPPDPARAGGAGAGAPGRGGGGAPGIPGAPSGVGGGGGFGRPAGVVYVVSSDGILHVLGLASGKDLQKPALFLPANARWSDPIAVGETMYAATSQNCGGAPNGIWAIDLAGENKPVTAWTTNGGGIVGALAFLPDGTLIAAIGPGAVTPGGYTNAIVAFDPKTLHVNDWFTSPTAEFTSTPLVFRHNDKDIVAAATRDGRVLLLDATSLGGANHATPLYASASFASSPGTFAPEALAMWQEMLPVPDAPAAAVPPPAAAGAPAQTPAPPPVPTMQPGTRWLLLPVAGPLPASGTWPVTSGAITNGAIVALKVVDDGGTLSLQPGWVSRDLASPTTPIIVNGVVFAVSKGRQTTPAVLSAVNGVDGKELWNSGTAITSYLPGRSFWSANGQVYVATFDGTIYAFGFAMERK